MALATACSLILPYLPTSMNRSMYAHWAKRRDEKRSLQADLETLLLEAKVPRPIPGDFVFCSAVLTVPDRRRRDADNYRTPLTKALGDAMVNGGFLPDDTPDHYEFGTLRFEHDGGSSGQTQIELSWR